MEKTLTELRQELAELKAELESKQKEAENWEVEISDEQYDDMLDDIYGEVQIAGMSYSTSYALKELDPTAYRCGKSDFESGMDKEDDPKYQELQEKIEELEFDIADLEDQIELLERWRMKWRKYCVAWWDVDDLADMLNCSVEEARVKLEKAEADFLKGRIDFPTLLDLENY